MVFSCFLKKYKTIFVCKSVAKIHIFSEMSSIFSNFVQNFFYGYFIDSRSFHRVDYRLGW